MPGERGSPRIERAPSARGPNSMRPWNQPTAFCAGEGLRGGLDHLVLAEHIEVRARRRQPSLDLGLREARAEKRAGMPSAPLTLRGWPLKMMQAASAAPTAPPASPAAG